MMMENLIKMYAMTRRIMTETYGEAFTSLTKEAQAAATLKALSDAVKIEPSLCATLVKAYLADIA